MATCEEGHDAPMVISTQSHAERHPVIPAIGPTQDDPRLTEHEQRSGVERRADAEYNHPQHYGGADNPYEAIKVIMAWGLGFNLGNAVKYISRAGRKDPTKTIEDLKKARWYLDYEIARLDEAGAAAAHDIGG